MKKTIIILAIFLGLSTIATGCKSSNQADMAGTFVFGRGADSTSLDPIQVTDGESIKVTESIFDTLVDYDKKSTTVVPHLAKSWTTSKDGLTWNFKLQEGVKFHDGTPLDAEAVVFNFNRWMDKKHPQHKGGEFPYYAYMFGGFKDDKGHVIKSVIAVSPLEIKFELDHPLGPFLSNLAMSPFAIASPTAVKKDPVAFNQNPVGSGPFKFVNWKKNNAITLEKNENYWQKDLPKLNRIVFKSIPDNAARFTALQSGDIDMMDGMNPDDVKLVQKNDKLQLFKQPGMNVAYLAFNTQKKPFNNVKVRQALNHAINKEGIINSFYAGLATPAINPMPEMMWGYNKNVKDYSFDLKKAKQLLAEAGYPQGFTVEFYAMTEPRPYMPNGKKIAEFIQEDLKTIGVKTKIVTYDWQTYTDRLGKGEHEMGLLGWNGDNGDPDNFLYVLLDKDNTRTPDAGNVAFYMSGKVHELLKKAQRSSDKAERTKLYEEVQLLIKEDAPWAPLVHTHVPLSAAKKISGFIPHPTGNLNLEQVSFK